MTNASYRQFYIFNLPKLHSAESFKYHRICYISKQSDSIVLTDFIKWGYEVASNSEHFVFDRKSW